MIRQIHLRRPDALEDMAVKPIEYNNIFASWQGTRRTTMPSSNVDTGGGAPSTSAETVGAAAVVVPEKQQVLISHLCRFF